jgi:predicted 2-oxoglutarate/Fe(II)-dependent dioxygenase YbiX
MPDTTTSFRLTVGDPMPRIVLPLAAGSVFDSWDQANAGRIQVFWLNVESARAATQALSGPLAACEADLRVVAPAPPPPADACPTWLVDKPGDLGRAVGASDAAIVIDASGVLAAVVRGPTPDAVVAIVARLHGASEPGIVRGHAPVLLIDRAIDGDLCTALTEHWRRGDKLADGVASAAGASQAGADAKRRRDVPVDDKRLFGVLRDSLVRRVVPVILRAFQTRIVQIELPLVGCYDSESGGWFRRHRDNTTPFTAHRQFALSLNLNPADEYEGGEVRFPEFGRQLYKPPAGGALVFSCSLLHEVSPMRRGRRFGLFTFLHDESRDAQYRRMLAEQVNKGMTGVRMRLAALWLPLAQCWELVGDVAALIV